MNPAIRNKLNRQEGYTLVELLLVIILMFFVVSIITLTYFTSVNASRQVIDASSAEIDSRTAMYHISSELREAEEIIEAGADSITFSSDIDSDDIADEVRYHLQSQNSTYRLFKSVNGQSSRPVAPMIISESIFTYYSSGETELNIPISEEELEDIVMVEINIMIDKSGQYSGNTMELGTIVTLRNKI